MISLKGVKKSYGDQEVFLDLNLTFEASNTYSIVGSSGSGKTTFLENFVMGTLMDIDTGNR